MNNYYKYKPKSKEINSRKVEFVKQMLNKKRDERFTFRLPAELIEKLNQESKPSNIIIELLAEKYYTDSFEYNPEEWKEETAEW